MQLVLVKRFAAKEAAAKALGTGFRNGVFWRDLEVTNLPSGKPTITFHGNSQLQLKKKKIANDKEPDISLTITDEFPYAQAIVTLNHFLMTDKFLSKSWFKSNFLTLIYALLIALLIRTFIPTIFYSSSSMEPNLLIGDRLFASKYDYGYSKHSFPFSLGPISDRVLSTNPEEECYNI